MGLETGKCLNVNGVDNLSVISFGPNSQFSRQALFSGEFISAAMSAFGQFRIVVSSHRRMDSAGKIGFVGFGATSIDGGMTWRQQVYLAPSAKVTEFKDVTALNAGRVLIVGGYNTANYLASTPALFVSNNSGTSWALTTLGTPSGLIPTRISGVGTTAMLVTGMNVGVSTNSGTSWVYRQLVSSGGVYDVEMITDQIALAVASDGVLRTVVERQ